MLHHEESPEKPQYNMATPPFLDKPPPPILPNHSSPFLAKIFRPPPFPSILKKSNPSFMKGGGGVQTMMLNNTSITTSKMFYSTSTFRVDILQDAFTNSKSRMYD